MLKFSKSNDSGDAEEPLLEAANAPKQDGALPTPTTSPSRRMYASIIGSTLTERSRSPVEMDPFWVPPPCSTDEKDKSYHIISVPSQEKPKFPWRSPSPFIVYDYLLTLLLVYIAIGLVQQSSLSASWSAWFGAVLFQAALIAAVMVLYTIFSTCGRRCIQWNDLLLVAAFGLSIYLTRSSGSSQPWTLLFSKHSSRQQVVGTSLLVAVLVHVISRGLFVLPNKDDAIIMLKRQVNSLEHSIALGLAEQYYHDFVCQAGRAVQAARDGLLPVAYPTSMGTSSNANEDEDDVEFRTDPMDVPCIVLAMPLGIDWHQEHFIQDLKRSYLSAGLLLPCRISPGPSWLCVTGVRQGYVVDAAPRPLELLMDHVRRSMEYASDEARTDQYRKEIRRFSHRLAWLAKKDGLEDYVKIVEFERDVMAHLPQASNQVFRELRHVTHWPSSGSV